MGLEHCSNVFSEHRISGDVLLDLSSGDLAEIGVHAIGDRKRILRAVAQLSTPQETPGNSLSSGLQRDCAVASMPRENFCPQQMCPPPFLQNNASPCAQNNMFPCSPPCNVPYVQGNGFPCPPPYAQSHGLPCVQSNGPPCLPPSWSP